MKKQNVNKQKNRTFKWNRHYKLRIKREKQWFCRQNGKIKSKNETEKTCLFYTRRTHVTCSEKRKMTEKMPKAWWKCYSWTFTWNSSHFAMRSRFFLRLAPLSSTFLCKYFNGLAKRKEKQWNHIKLLLFSTILLIRCRRLESHTHNCLVQIQMITACQKLFFR